MTAIAGIGRREAVLGGIALFAAGIKTADAHRLHMAFSEVVWRPASKRIAVTHRLDSEDASLAVLGPNGRGDITGLRERALCARYVAARFSLAESGSAPMPLELIGAEVVGRFVFIYQEFAAPRLRTAVVGNSIFFDILPDQVNRVNFDTGHGVKTLVFVRDDGLKSIALD